MRCFALSGRASPPSLEAGGRFGHVVILGGSRPARGERPISEFVCLVLGTVYAVDQNGNVTSQTLGTGTSAKPVEIGCLLGLV
jgi:hypothetical protein